MKFANDTKAVYINRGHGDFSKLLDVSLEETGYTLTFERSEYNPAVFGTLSTLETPTEIVIARRSNEVTGGFQGKFSGFGGGTPFGLTNFKKWTEERVKFEMNYSPRLELVGLVLDNEEQCSVFGYRGFVDKIENIPSYVKSAYGNIKYSEITVLPKSQLGEFLQKNKGNVSSHFEPLLSYIVAKDLQLFEV